MNTAPPATHRNQVDADTSIARHGRALAWCGFVLAVFAGAAALGLVAMGDPAAPARPPLGGLFDGASPFRDALGRLLERSGIGPAAQALLGPFADIGTRMAVAAYTAVFPGARDSSLHWLFLFLMLLIAVALFVMRGGRGAKGADGVERRTGLREYLLPAAIYTHPSARVDLALYVIDRALMPVWGLLFLGALGPFVKHHVTASLALAFGPGPALAVNAGWQFAFGLATLLAVDLCFFLYHLMMHRTRLGWAIHKVHHAAEVLTPVTVAREHFLEAPIYIGSVTVGAATVAGVFSWLFRGELVQITLMGVGVLSFLYLLNSNFRHYHVCLRYPPWLERWLMSPGMHHSHHSTLRHHWDSNLGLFTSIWDRLYGTLYIGSRFEATPWGLPPEEQARCRSLADNLLAPFRELAAMLRR